MIDRLSETDVYTLSKVQAYSIFFSLSLSMAAFGAAGVWLLLHSKMESSLLLRIIAWPLNVSCGMALVLVWMVSFAEH